MRGIENTNKVSNCNKTQHTLQRFTAIFISTAKIKNKIVSYFIGCPDIKIFLCQVPKKCCSRIMNAIDLQALVFSLG